MGEATVQFTKAESVLHGMGLHLGETAGAQAELAEGHGAGPLKGAPHFAPVSGVGLLRLRAVMRAPYTPRRSEMIRIG